MVGVSSRKLSEISVPEIRILAPSMERGLDASPPPPRRPPPLSLSSASSRHHSVDEDDTSEHESAFSLQSSPRCSGPLTTFTCTVDLVVLTITYRIEWRSDSLVKTREVDPICHRFLHCDERFAVQVSLNIIVACDGLLLYLLSISISTYNLRNNLFLLLSHTPRCAAFIVFLLGFIFGRGKCDLNKINIPMCKVYLKM